MSPCAPVGSRRQPTHLEYIRECLSLQVILTRLEKESPTEGQMCILVAGGRVGTCGDRDSLSGPSVALAHAALIKGSAPLQAAAPLLGCTRPTSAGPFMWPRVFSI